MGILYAMTAAILAIGGNVAAKEWSVHRGTGLYLATVALYVASSFVFPLALKHGTLTVLNTLAAIVPIVITVGIGVWWYKEDLTSVQLVGLALGLVAAILLSLPGETA